MLDLIHDRGGIEPPPALAGADDIEPILLETRSLCRGFDELDPGACSGVASNLEKLGGDVETGGMQSAAGESDRQRASACADVEDSLVLADPSPVLETIEQAFRKPWAVLLVIRRRSAEVETAIVCRRFFDHVVESSSTPRPRPGPTWQNRPMRANPMREKWTAGEVAMGGWLAVPSSITAEAMAACDLEYLCIDMQHGLIDYSDSVGMLQAITLGTATPLVRVPENTTANISKALDAGAMAVIIPMVNSTEQCEEAVSSCFYAPKGSRSHGATRAAAVEGPDYLERANNSVACIPMIETVEAVDDIDGILSVPGVEAIYVGPADLAISMGLPPGGAQAEFLAVLDSIVEACNRHAVVPGIHATPTTTADRVERGFRMITVVADLKALKSGVASAIATARGDESTGSSALY